MRKATASIAVLLLLVVATLTVVHYRHKTPAQTQSATSVTIAQAANTLLYLPLYVALDEGFLKQNGVDAHIITSGGDSQAFATLASGQAQFAQGDPTFVAISHSHGGPGIVVASVLDRVAFWGVSFNNSLQPFSDPSGFKNLKVVTFPDPNTAYVVQKDLDARAGLTLGKNANIIQAAFGTELSPLQNGKADIAATIEPTVSTSLQQGAHIVFSYPDAWGPFALTGLMTTEDYAAQHPAVVQGTVTAYEQALQFIRANPDAAVTIGQHYFPTVSKDVIQTAIQRLVSENVFPAHAMMSQDSWDAAIKLREEVGDLPTGSYDSLNDQSYGSKAIQNLPK
jgi:NitT/TauT family transport system substrate-binding protein